MNSPLFETFQLNASAMGSGPPALRVHYTKRSTRVEPSAFEIMQWYSKTSIPMEETWTEGVNQLGTGPYPTHMRETVPVQDSSQAEDIIFSIPPIIDRQISLDGTLQTGLTNHSILPLPNLINTLGNKIAMRTRRGAGNVVFISQRILDYWTSLTYSGFAFSTINKVVGRWTHVGVANSTLMLYVGDVLPDNEVVSAYVGHPKLIDGPAGLFDDQGSLGLYVMKQDPSFMCSADDYLQRIRITNLP